MAASRFQGWHHAARIGDHEEARGADVPDDAGARRDAEAQRATADALPRKTESIIPWVFHRTKRDRSLKGFTKAWRTAGIAAGGPGRNR